ncbi:MAG: hypothetical protein ACYS0H_00450 [Planctomycetota bacterium]|jgi:hypothetical protein
MRKRDGHIQKLVVKLLAYRYCLICVVVFLEIGFLLMMYALASHIYIRQVITGDAVTRISQEDDEILEVLVRFKKDDVEHAEKLGCLFSVGSELTLLPVEDSISFTGKVVQWIEDRSPRHIKIHFEARLAEHDSTHEKALEYLEGYRENRDPTRVSVNLPEHTSLIDVLMKPRRKGKQS